MTTFFFSGMTIFLIICTVFPNGLNLRPDTFVRDNIFVDMVRQLYQTDTSTNVLPSIHVFNSIGAVIAISHSDALKKHKAVQYSSYLLRRTYHSVHYVLKTALGDRCDCSHRNILYYLSLRIRNAGT